MINQVDFEINKELGECYLFMGEYEKAQTYYTKAIECDKQRLEPYLGLAAIALFDGKMNDAYVYYNKANSLEQTDKTLAGMAMIECESGEHEKAYQNFSAALDKNPINMVAVNGLLQLSHFLGRLNEMLPRLEIALGLNNDESIRYAYAACLLSLGREDDAKAQLEILLGSNPANAEAQQLYAQFAA